MKSYLGAWITLAIVAGCAHAQPATTAAAPSAPAANPPASAPAASSADVDPILDALDKRGKELSDFTADVTLADRDVANGDEAVMSGKMWMQKVSADDTRLRVSFERKTRNDKPEKVHQEYVLAGGTLTDRNYDVSKETRWQVLKPGQKMNLLKLGEGPFPLPLGQDKADVHKMFDVAKIAPAKDDPAGTQHVQLKPKDGTRFAEKFATIDFWVDPESNMPVRIVTNDPNGTLTRTTELKNVQVNTKLNEKVFALDPVDEKSWHIVDEAYQD